MSLSRRGGKSKWQKERTITNMPTTVPMKSASGRANPKFQLYRRLVGKRFIPRNFYSPNDILMDVPQMQIAQMRIARMPIARMPIARTHCSNGTYGYTSLEFHTLAVCSKMHIYTFIE